MAAKYSRLPTEDVELGQIGQSAFDYRSAFSYGQSFPSTQNYKSIFKYNQKKSMYEDDIELSVVRQSLFSRVCAVFMTFLCILVCIVTFPVSAFFSIKIVTENERLVVFRLGRMQGVKGPGVVMVIPCVDKWKKVDIRIKAFNVPPLQILTQDAGIIEIGADVYYTIKDVAKSITSVQDLNSSLRALVRTTMTNKLVKNDLDDIEAKKNFLIKDILEECNTVGISWGIDISRLEFSPIKVLQAPQVGASLPGGQETLTQVFQQLAGAFLNKTGQPSSGPNLQYADKVIDPAGAAVASEDVKLEPQFTPLELMILVKGVLNETLVRSVGATYQFNLSGPNGGMFFMDLKNGSGFVKEGPDPSGDPDVTLDLSTSDMHQMFTRKLNPLQAYMSGRLKVSGDLSSALRLEELIDRIISKASSGSGAGIYSSKCVSTSEMHQMFTRKLNPLQAYMSGRLKVSGDLSSALRLEELVDRIISKASSGSGAGS